MEFVLTKGMAMAIRAIFNIDPVLVQTQLNDTVWKAEKAFTDLNHYLKHFDDRLIAQTQEIAALNGTVMALLNEIRALKLKGGNLGNNGSSENIIGVVTAIQGNGCDTTATG